MPIRFLCQHCRKRNSVSRRMAGQVVKCPRCGEETKVVPEPDSAPGTPPPVDQLGSTVSKPSAVSNSNSFARDAINAARTANEQFADEGSDGPPDGDDVSTSGARVGSSFFCIESSICVAVITGVRCSLHRRMIRFCRPGTR